MQIGPPPSHYDLYNRLQRAEAGLRATEKGPAALALAALSKRLNVNRPRDPELDLLGDRARDLDWDVEELGRCLNGLVEAVPDSASIEAHESAELEAS